MAEKYKRPCFFCDGVRYKTDVERGRTLNLDISYQNMLKPAVEAAGLKCIRADKIVHPGVIDVPIYEQLLTAEAVVADLSISNKNALYELGLSTTLEVYIQPDVFTSYSRRCAWKYIPNLVDTPRRDRLSATLP